MFSGTHFASLAFVAALVGTPLSAHAAAPVNGPAVVALHAKDGERWVEEGDKRACEKQPALAWCKRGEVVASTRTADEDRALVTWADAVARRSWRTPKPGNNPEHWESFADDALTGKAWVGDCDNLTFTALDLLARQGVPADRLFRVIRPSSKPGVGHMVGVVKTADGQYLVVGDSMQKGVYALPPAYPITSVNQVSDGRIWYDISAPSKPPTVTAALR